MNRNPFLSTSEHSGPQPACAKGNLGHWDRSLCKDPSFLGRDDLLSHGVFILWGVFLLLVLATGSTVLVESLFSDCVCISAKEILFHRAIIPQSPLRQTYPFTVRFASLGLWEATSLQESNNVFLNPRALRHVFISHTCKCLKQQQELSLPFLLPWDGS